MTTTLKLKKVKTKISEARWWTTRLDGVQKTHDGWKAKCPAHDDNVQSLSIKEDQGDILVHCFAGCEYADIVAALEDDVQMPSSPAITINYTRQTTEDAGAWWESYTGIPLEFWEGLGFAYTDTHIFFLWNSLQTRKSRQANTKEITWSPSGGTAPPLWPEVGKEIPPIVWIAEGESDTGVLRYLGFDAYGVTKGARTPMDTVLAALASRGVREIIPVFDLDSAGLSSILELQELAPQYGIICSTINLGLFLDPLLGEKDMLDAWRRYRDVDTLRAVLESAYQQTQVLKPKKKRVTIDEFLSTPVQGLPWIIDRTWLAGSIGMIVGMPKMGKSWLALDMAISIATGKPFLGTWDIINPGSVVYLTKEDPDHLLQDRITKIMVQKGLGGHFDADHGVLKMPSPMLHPVHLDLTRDFLFTAEKINSLVDWIDDLCIRDGQPPKMVIFDPILRMLVDVDEFKASAINSAIFQAAGTITQKFGSSCALVHHRSKGGMEGRQSYGSIAFHAFSENTLYLQGNEPDPDGWINVTGEYKSAPEQTWSYRFPELEDSYQVEVATHAKASNLKSTLPTAIMEALDKVGLEGASIQELGEALDMSAYMIRESIKILEGQNRVLKSKGENPPGVSGPKPIIYISKEL